MKVFAALFAFLAVANAFAPMPAGRANTQLAESLMDKVSKASSSSIHQRCDLRGLSR